MSINNSISQSILKIIPCIENANFKILCKNQVSIYGYSLIYLQSNKKINFVETSFV